MVNEALKLTVGEQYCEVSKISNYSEYKASTSHIKSARFPL